MSRQPIRLAIIEAAAELERAGVPSARVDAELLAAHVLGVERTRLGLVPLVDPSVIEEYRELVARRVQRIPLQHITGSTAMGNVSLEVGPGVFVPRPETELLLAWALAHLEASGLRAMKPIGAWTIGNSTPVWARTRFIPSCLRRAPAAP